MTRARAHSNNYAFSSLVRFFQMQNVAVDCLLLLSCVCELRVECILARVIPFHLMIIVGIFTDFATIIGNPGVTDIGELVITDSDF